MHSRAIVLRLLLCLVLVANGTTAAFANVRMAMMDSAAATQQDDAPPCHDMQADDAATIEHDAPSIPGSHEDCCGSACLCDCVAHATAFFLAVDALALTTRAAAPPVSAPQESRAAPALPHPIRPPIG